MIILMIGLLPFTASERVEIINEGGKRIIHLIGSVSFERPGLNITCDQATILGERTAMLRGKVVLKESTTTITADSLRFMIKTGTGIFYNSVLSDSSLVIAACSLRYDPNIREIHGFDSVEIRDTTNSLTVNADYFIYNLNTGVGESDGNPVLSIKRENETPLVAHSRTIHYYRNQDRLNLADSVIINDHDMTITCDSLNFHNQTSSGELYSLNIKTESERVEGDHGKFTIKDRAIESMDITAASVIRNAEDREDRVTSDQLSIKFESGSILKAIARGNPRGKVTWK